MEKNLILDIPIYTKASLKTDRFNIKETTSAIGKVAVDVTRALNNDVWFRYVDCINVTEQTHNGTYKEQEVHNG